LQYLFLVQGVPRRGFANNTHFYFVLKIKERKEKKSWGQEVKI